MVYTIPFVLHFAPTSLRDFCEKVYWDPAFGILIGKNEKGIELCESVFNN